ncbi:MAG: hypothetical protein ABIP69_02145 [Ferruginibacter sp.]
MKIIASIALLFLFTLSACKKPKIEKIETNNSSDSLTYQPKVAGSKWIYNRYAAGGLSNRDYNFIRRAEDSLYRGKTFNLYDSEIDGLQLLRQEGNKYYQVLTASTNKPVLLVLDADKNIGESWVGGVNGSDTYTYVITQKLPVYVLDGFTFRNTIVVNQIRTNTSGNTTMNVDSYYAQGVGLVKSEGVVSSFGVTIKLLVLDLR